MAFSDALLTVGANAMRSAIGGMQLHTENPGAGGAANKSSAGMKVPSFTIVSGSGNFDLAAPVPFTGATPNGPIKWVSLWSNTSGSGTWYGNFQLTGDLTADSDGKFTVNSGALSGSSS